MLHIVACAPGTQFSLFLQLVCVPGAQATTHRVVLTLLIFRAQVKGVSVHPAVTQMMPKTRHYVHRRLILNKIEDICEDNANFTRIYDDSYWKSIAAELFPRK